MPRGARRCTEAGAIILEYVSVVATVHAVDYNTKQTLYGESPGTPFGRRRLGEATTLEEAPSSALSGLGAGHGDSSTPPHKRQLLFGLMGGGNQGDPQADFKASIASSLGSGVGSDDVSILGPHTVPALPLHPVLVCPLPTDSVARCACIPGEHPHPHVELLQVR